MERSGTRGALITGHDPLLAQRDRGHSLTEVLIAMALLGTVVVATLTGIQSVIIASESDRNHAQTFEWLQAASDAVHLSDRVPCTDDGQGRIDAISVYDAEAQGESIPPVWSGTSATIEVVDVEYLGRSSVDGDFEWAQSFCFEGAAFDDESAVYPAGHDRGGRAGVRGSPNPRDGEERMTAATTRGRHRADGGFTLVEVTLTMMISGVLIAALATAISAAIRTTPANEDRIDDARSTRALSTYLAQDTISTPPFSPEQDQGGFNVASSDQPDNNDCGAAGTNIVHMQWTETVVDEADVRRELSLRPRGRCGTRASCHLLGRRRGSVHR